MVLSMFILGTFLAACSPLSESEHQAARFLPDSLPTDWTLTISTDFNTFRPLRGLTNAVAQLTLVNTSVVLKRDLAPEESKEFHPNLILFVFPKSELKVVEQAVENERFRSDYPPIVFGRTEKYIFVTSPGYVNDGLHTPEAEVIIQKLKDSLRSSMEIR